MKYLCWKLAVLMVGTSVLNADVFFVDTFDSAPDSRWQNQRGAWYVSNGVYDASLPNNSPVTYTSLPFILTNFSVDVDIQNVSDGGIWLRTDDTADNGVILVTGGGFWGGGARGGSAGQRLFWNVVANGTAVGGDLGLVMDAFSQPGVEDIHLRIEVTGNVYAAFLNGSRTPITCITNDYYAAGKVGLYDFSSEQTFDNFIVSKTSPTGTCYHVAIDSGNDLRDGLTWPTAKRTIQNAVNAAAPGDTVLVSNGVYYLSSELAISNGITLLGVGGAAAVVIDGSNAYRCVNILASNTVMGGVSIRNGFSTDKGAGVLNLYGGVLSNCYIYGNVSSNASSSFANNGGGLYLQGGVATDCLIFSNSTSAGSGGGGVYLNQAGLVTRCQIFNNYSYGDGSGARCFEGGTVEDCRIFDNHGGTGARIYRGGTFSRCAIFSNTGGGAKLASGTMRNCLVYNNTRNGSGAGIVLFSASATVENCTITGNQATDAGGGVYVQSGDNSTGSPGPNIFRNLILYGNSATNGMNYAWAADTSVVFSAEFSCLTPMPATGVGNITNDPLFANAAVSNFLLAGNSPCINHGTNLAWMATASDGAGNPRIIGGIVDMGAYEAPQTVQLTAFAGAGGAINPSGLVFLPPGTNISFVLSANTNNHIWKLVVDGVPTGSFGPGSNAAVYTFMNVVTNHSIVALFSGDRNGSAPAWWRDHGVLSTHGAVVTNDGAVANLGQLKWMATQAYDAMHASLPGGAGPALSNLVAGLSCTNNFMAVNSGQAKAVALPFYDRLGELQGATNYPWTGASQTNNFGAVNVGQLKQLFSFELPN